MQGADLTSTSVGVERLEEVGRDEGGQALARQDEQAWGLQFL